MLGLKDFFQKNLTLDNYMNKLLQTELKTKPKKQIGARNSKINRETRRNSTNARLRLFFAKNPVFDSFFEF